MNYDKLMRNYRTYAEYNICLLFSFKFYENKLLHIHTYIYISSLLLKYHKLSFYVVIIHSTFSVITRYQIDIVCNTLNNLVSLSRKLKDYRLR